MAFLGENWTIRSDGFEATNYGMLSGNLQWQRDMSQRVVDAAISCGANTVIVPECGSAYNALRWQAADILDQELPFRVLHISEFLAEQVEQGTLTLTSAAETATFHDPCQVARRGGVIDAPRTIFKALGVELQELPGGREMNWCCGGGGGVMHLQRSDELRYQNFKLKMHQVEETRAQIVYTSCANCRANFENCSEHHDWDVETRSLLGLVASHLAE
jgi:Fe-S oxidoreductase